MAKPRILYDSRLKDGTPTASGTASGYDVNNLTDFRTYTKWQPDALPATVTVDAGSALGVDYWLIWGHDLGTQGATIQLRKSNDNFSANDVLVDSVTPSDDEPFVRYVTTADERYWRLNITGTTVPTIGIAAMGDYLSLDGAGGLDVGFDPVGRTSMGPFNRSVEGDPLGRSRAYDQWGQDITIPLVSWAWFRTAWIPAWDAHLAGNPFVFDWNPGDATYGGEIRHVAMEGAFDGPHSPGQVADLRFTIGGKI